MLVAQRRPLLCEGLISKKSYFWLGLFSGSSPRSRAPGSARSKCQVRHTSVGVELCAVQVVDNLLDGRLGAVPVELASAIVSPTALRKLCGVFKSSEELGVSSHLPVSSDKELASHDGQLVSDGIVLTEKGGYRLLGRSRELCSCSWQSEEGESFRKKRTRGDDSLSRSLEGQQWRGTEQEHRHGKHARRRFWWGLAGTWRLSFDGP